MSNSSEKSVADIAKAFNITSTQATATTGVVDTIVDISIKSLQSIANKDSTNYPTKKLLEQHMDVLKSITESPVLRDSSNSIALMVKI